MATRPGLHVGSGQGGGSAKTGMLCVCCPRTSITGSWYAWLLRRVGEVGVVAWTRNQAGGSILGFWHWIPNGWMSTWRLLVVPSESASARHVELHRLFRNEVFVLLKERSSICCSYDKAEDQALCLVSGAENCLISIARQGVCHPQTSKRIQNASFRPVHVQ